jgi:hypothetical protein
MLPFILTSVITGGAGRVGKLVSPPAVSFAMRVFYEMMATVWTVLVWGKVGLG